MRFAYRKKPAALNPGRRTASPSPADRWATAMPAIRPREEEPDRLEEIISLARAAGCRRVGLAYCAELAAAARLLGKALQRHFTVKMVPCQPQAERQLSPPGADTRSHCPLLCDPLAQSAALNRCGADLVIAVGLCTRQDILLKKCAHAPVSTLAVRDRALDNRPLEGLYTGYYFNLFGLQPGG